MSGSIVTNGSAGQEDQVPVLSIVLVNCDSTKLTLQCLESIYENPPHDPFEVVLVDDSSRDPCLEKVQGSFPKVRLYSPSKHQGFAKNYNLGMRQSRGKYVVILNNDTVVQGAALDTLLGEIRGKPDIAMVGPLLVNPSGRLQTVCARSLLTPLSYALRLLVLDPNLPTGRLWDAFLQRRLAKRCSGPVPCISGACILSSRKVIDRIGLLDEDYDFYFEDVEWCHRAHKYGFEIAFIAEAMVTHYGDQSLSKVKEWAKRSEYKGAIRYFRQYHHLTNRQRNFLWLVTLLSFASRMITFKLIEVVHGGAGPSLTYWNLVKWIAQEGPKRPDPREGNAPA